jgi:predicted CoA-binding protein/protein-tyrosine-phosphatase
VASEPPAAATRRILIVCHANTSRSIIAEALLRRMLQARRRADVVVCSGGVAPYARDSSLVSLDARLLLREDAIDIPADATSCDLKKHRERIVEADVILTMTEEQRAMLAGFAEAAGKEVLTLREAAGETGDIDDPAGREADFHRVCRDEIRRCLEKAFDRLAPLGENGPEMSSTPDPSGSVGFRNPPDTVIREILGSPKTIAVIGCSPDETRDSHRIARLLQQRGHRMIPVNPTADVVLGERCRPTLAAIEERVDVVDVFRRPDAVPAIVDEAIAAGAPVLWLQLGVVHVEAALRAQRAGLTVVMDRCPAIEYPRLFGGGGDDVGGNRS